MLCGSLDRRQLWRRMDTCICMTESLCCSLEPITLLICYEMKWSEITQSCLTLCDPMDCSLQGSSVPGILQAGILEWVAISFSRRSSQPRDRTWVSHIAGRCFIIWATREVLICYIPIQNKKLKINCTGRSDWSTWVAEEEGIFTLEVMINLGL